MLQKIVVTLVVVLALSLSGCASLKKENQSLKAQVGALTQGNQKMSQDNQICQESLNACKGTLNTCKEEAAKKESELKAKEAKVVEQSNTYKQMQEAMKAELASKQVAIQELEGKLTLTMVESILFDSGKAVVKEEGVEALTRVAEVLKTTKDQDVIIAGHTDNVKISAKLTKKYPSNWELSASRAIAVVKLLETNGVDPKILCASGFSEYRPVADNDTPEGKAKNRRMEIILMPKRK